MSVDDAFKQGVTDLKRALESGVRTVRAAKANGEAHNVAYRSNVVVAGNVGEEDSAQHASGIQMTDIRQMSRTTSERCTGETSAPAERS